MASTYIQCLVCGRPTPVDKGICYHCGSPLPSKVLIPKGTVVCPNCLKVTPVSSGYCTHCRAKLPEEWVRLSGEESGLEPPDESTLHTFYGLGSGEQRSPRVLRVPSVVWLGAYKPSVVLAGSREEVRKRVIRLRKLP